MCFYEKVIKVKADVAAVLNSFPSCINLRWRLGELSRASPKGTFILTLVSSPSHFTIELGTKRNAVQLSFVP